MGFPGFLRFTHHDLHGLVWSRFFLDFGLTSKRLYAAFLAFDEIVLDGYPPGGLVSGIGERISGFSGRIEIVDYCLNLNIFLMLVCDLMCDDIYPCPTCLY